MLRGARCVRSEKEPGDQAFLLVRFGMAAPEIMFQGCAFTYIMGEGICIVDAPGFPLVPESQTFDPHWEPMEITRQGHPLLVDKLCGTGLFGDRMEEMCVPKDRN